MADNKSNTKKEADAKADVQTVEKEAKQAQDAQALAEAEANAKALADMKLQMREMEKKLEEKTEAEAQANKLVIEMASKKNADSTPIQCLITRKGGTRVSFGRNAATQTEYHFKPLDENDDTSPHVAMVDNDEHAARFLSITESYRLYRGQTGPVDRLPIASAVIDEDAFVNRFDDILSIDFEQIENKVVSDWAKDVLGFTNAQAAQVKKKAADMDIEVLSSDSMTGVLRKIGQAMQAEEQAASDQAKKL